MDQTRYSYGASRSWRSQQRPAPPAVRDNALLALLPPSTRRDVDRDLVRLHLNLQHVLQQAHPTMYAIFPQTAVLSVITRMADGQTVENAVIGYEGVWTQSAGMPQIEVVVQGTGEAYGMTEEAWLRHRSNPDLVALIHAYSTRLFLFSAQSCACQVFHTAEQRLARWLLEMRDRTDNDELPLTQEFIAAMLGVQRPTVTLAARILQVAEIIRYRYGRISILDRASLEDAACECYRLLPRPGVTEAPRA